jgi:drug/metabolite transporter (DMT)-like permease
MSETLSLAFLTPYLMAVASNLFFGTASIKFSYFAARFSPAWMNQVKVTIALAGFLLLFIFTENFVQLTTAGWASLLGSGILGLFLGDWFLFQAFAHLGATRTLVIYSFQPFLVGLYGYLFLNQGLNIWQLTAIFCMIACVLTFVVERNRQVGHWDLKFFLYAFVGIVFDALGLVLSRQAYELSPDLGSSQANATRAFAAVAIFILVKPSSLKILYQDLKNLAPTERSHAIGASLMGTFVSLSFYLYALKTAHVASLTAISITGPIWVSFIEHIQQKKWPNRYLWIAFGFFLLGFSFMTKGLLQ